MSNAKEAIQSIKNLEGLPAHEISSHLNMIGDGEGVVKGIMNVVTSISKDYELKIADLKLQNQQKNINTGVACLAIGVIGTLATVGTGGVIWYQNKMKELDKKRRENQLERAMNEEKLKMEINTLKNELIIAKANQMPEINDELAKEYINAIIEDYSN